VSIAQCRDGMFRDFATGLVAQVVAPGGCRFAKPKSFSSEKERS
jgi:hypothetical protein